MDALVGSRATDKRRLFGIRRIGFRDGAGSDKGRKEVTLNCFPVYVPFKCVVSAILSIIITHDTSNSTYNCIPE